MRILLVADIHANWAALQAITEPFDMCLFLGDAVDYGLEPAPCLEWIRQKASFGVRGNHDHGAAQHVTVFGRSGFKYLTAVTRQITQERLTPDDRRFLSRLPITRMVTIDSRNFFLVHATPRDPLDEYGLVDADFWQRRLEHIDAHFICVGHTHHPYVLEVGNKIVVNPGSVGQPRDGDPRLSYAIYEDGKITLQRIEYPVDQTVQTIQESTLPEPAKGLLTQVLRTGAIPKPASSKHRFEK